VCSYPSHIYSERHKVVPMLYQLRNAMKTCEGVPVEIYVLFTSVIVGGEWSASRPTRFTVEETGPCCHWLGGGAGPRAGLEDADNRKFLLL
jgi:hypothetical protein